MRARQLVYNGQGIRHDGNYGLAKRIITHRALGERQHTVVLGFCGVDGSLLQPIQACETEDWPDIKLVLRPLLEGIKEARSKAGFSGECTIPVFHATDSYRKHHRMIASLCNEI